MLELRGSTCMSDFSYVIKSVHISLRQAELTVIWCVVTFPVGYFCLEGTANYTDNPCPTGYYCPSSTQNANDYPCPAGTFNNETMRTKPTDCLTCTGNTSRFVFWVCKNMYFVFFLIWCHFILLYCSKAFAHIFWHSHVYTYIISMQSKIFVSLHRWLILWQGRPLLTDWGL